MTDVLNNVLSGNDAVTGDAPPTPQGPPMAAPDQTAAPAPDQAAPAAAPAPAPVAAQPADDPNTHGWRSLLKGALASLGSHAVGAGEGYITGGIPGALVGAVAPKVANEQYQNQRQMAQNKIKFASAEAANQVVEAKMKDAQLQQLPKELQLKQYKLDGEMATKWIQGGVAPVIVVPNSDEGAHAAAQQLQDKFGHVPSLIWFHMGDQLVGFDPVAAADNAVVLKDVNLFQKITGGNPYTQQALKQAPNKTQLTSDASRFFNPPSPGTDKTDAQISQYKGYVRAISMWPDSDPDKADALARTKNTLANIQEGFDASTKRQKELAEARGSAAQKAKAVEVVGLHGPNDNTARLTDAGTAMKKGLTLSSTAAKSESKIAQLVDMQTGSQAVRTTLDALPVKGFSPDTITKLTAAMRSDDEGYIQKIADSLVGSGLSKQEADAASALLNLQERVLSLRSLGQQGQGSESQRKAITRLLPGIKDLNNRNLVKNKLDAFDQQTSIYYKNIVKPNVNTGTETSVPAAKATPQTHTFSVSAWKKANPTGDEKAAAAEAKKQNYTVIN